MAKLITILVILISQTSFSASANPKWEIRTAPIAFLWGWGTLDISYFANDNWAFGPSAVIYKGPKGNMFLLGYDGTAVGGHAIWAQSFVQDSVYVSTHFYSENYDDYPHAYLGHYEVTGSKINADLGKRWISGNSSTMFGIGYEIKNQDKTAIPNTGARVSSHSEYGYLHLEAKLGYFF